MKKILSVLLFLLSSKMAIAKDYGIAGNTYEIREKNFLQEIQEKLQEAKRNGKLAKFQESVKKKIENDVKNPRPVSGISKAVIAREWIFDPSTSFPHDMRDQKGEVFYKAHTRVNPLDYTSLSKVIIFIDGSDEKQVKWALSQRKLLKKPTKIILVAGPIDELMQKNNVRLYFDQNGIQTSKLNIKAVPAIVEQAGKMLRIREVPL